VGRSVPNKSKKLLTITPTFALRLVRQYAKSARGVGRVDDLSRFAVRTPPCRDIGLQLDGSSEHGAQQIGSWSGRVEHQGGGLPRLMNRAERAPLDRFRLRLFIEHDPKASAFVSITVKKRCNLDPKSRKSPYLPVQCPDGRDGSFAIARAHRRNNVRLGVTFPFEAMCTSRHFCCDAAFSQSLTREVTFVARAKGMGEHRSKPPKVGHLVGRLSPVLIPDSAVDALDLVNTQNGGLIRQGLAVKPLVDDERPRLSHEIRPSIEKQGV
jgi:hypothetical protein